MRLISEVRLYKVEIAVLQPVGEVTLADIPTILDWFHNQKANQIHRFVLIIDRVVAEQPLLIALLKALDDFPDQNDRIGICTTDPNRFSALARANASAQTLVFGSELMAIQSLTG